MTEHHESRGHRHGSPLRTVKVPVYLDHMAKVDGGLLT